MYKKEQSSLNNNILAKVYDVSFLNIANDNIICTAAAASGALSHYQFCVEQKNKKKKMCR